MDTNKREYIVRTDKELKTLAGKYTTRFSFASAHTGAYKTAIRRGILESICAHMPVRATKNQYKDSEIHQLMSKYISPKNLFNENRNLYYLAYRRFGLKKIRKFFDDEKKKPKKTEQKKV